MTPISPQTGTVTAWNLPSIIGSKSTWIVLIFGVMPVWSLKLAPKTSRQSDSFITQLATGVPLWPRTPAANGWLSEICPFPLKVVMTGQLSDSASSMMPGMV